MSETQQPKLFTRQDLALALAVVLVSLAVYMRTLVPWPLPGDSGEFQVLAHQVGIAHTTGYPVYILLARLFITLVPVNDVAYRANLFSAVAGALTVAGSYAAAWIATRSRWAALFGALALMVSSTFWSQALIAEVYTAGAAALVGVVLALLVWYRTENKTALFLAGLCGGAGLGFHANLGLFALSVGLFLLLHKSRWRALWRPALLGALIGVCVFLTSFVIVDLHAPPSNIFSAVYAPARSAWDLTEDDLNSPVTRIAFLLTARQWRGALFTDPLRDTPERLSAYLDNLPQEFSLVALGLAALGVTLLVRQNWRLAAWLGSALLLQWLVYFNYRVGDIFVFYIPGYIVMALLAAVGLAGIGSLTGRLPWRGRTILQPAVMLAFLIGGIAPVLSPNLDGILQGEAPFINERRFVADDTAEINYRVAANIVRQLEPNTILFTDWQRLYLYYYAAHVEQGRMDLRFIETYPHADTRGLARSIPEYIRAHLATHLIYFSDRVPEIERAGFTLRPVNIGLIRFYKVEES